MLFAFVLTTEQIHTRHRRLDHDFRSYHLGVFTIGQYYFAVSGYFYGAFFHSFDA